MIHTDVDLPEVSDDPVSELRNTGIPEVQQKKRGREYLLLKEDVIVASGHEVPGQTNLDGINIHDIYIVYCWVLTFSFSAGVANLISGRVSVKTPIGKKTQSSNSSNILLSLYRSFINSEYTVTYNYVQRNSLLFFISSLTTSFSTHYFYPHFSLQTLHTQLCTLNFAHTLTNCSPFYTFCVWGNPTHAGARFATHWYSRPASGTRKRPATGKPKMPAPGARRCPVTGSRKSPVKRARSREPGKAKYSSPKWTWKSQQYVYYAIYTQHTIPFSQDSRHYLTYPDCTSTYQVQDPLTERQSLEDDHLSTYLMFFSLALGIEPNWRGSYDLVVTQTTTYLSLPWVKLRFFQVPGLWLTVKPQW